MIDPKEYDNIDDYWQAMADEFGLSVSDVKMIADLDGEPTAELSLHLEDYFQDMYPTGHSALSGANPDQSYAEKHNAISTIGGCQ